MPLTISQGPLPQDGDRVAADIFLEAWVNGTTIGGFDAGSFLAVGLGLITSASEPPAFLNRGVFWFKRGEGTLYFREDPDRCDTRYTNSAYDAWLPIAPLRSHFVEVQNDSDLGSPATLGETQAGQPGSTTLGSYFRDCQGHTIPFYASKTSVFVKPGRVGMHCGIVMNNSGASGLPSPIVEWGIVNARIASGGSNVLRGTFAKLHYSAMATQTFFHSRAGAWTGETGYGSIGLIMEVNATSAEHLALIFKRPGVDYCWDGQV